jgi:hypothetical protein
MGARAGLGAARLFAAICFFATIFFAVIFFAVRMGWAATFLGAGFLAV